MLLDCFALCSLQGPQVSRLLPGIKVTPAVGRGSVHFSVRALYIVPVFVGLLAGAVAGQRKFCLTAPFVWFFFICHLLV